MFNRVSPYLKKIAIALAILVILLAIISSLFRALTPWVRQHKGEVEQRLSAIVGQPVTIKTIKTGWYWFQPVLQLQQLSVEDSNKKTLHLDTLLIGINLLKSLWDGKLAPGVIYVDTMHVVLREKDGHWQVDGISNAPLTATTSTPEKTQQFLQWLAQQDRLVIRHVSAQVYTQKQGLISLNGLNVSMVKQGSLYRLSGSASMEKGKSALFQLAGHLQFDPLHLEYTQGQLYFSAKQVAASQWQQFMPQTVQYLYGGLADVDVWVDVKKGAVIAVQAEVKAQNLLLGPSKKQSTAIQSIYANLAWKPNSTGWDFQARPVRLKLHGVAWPDNQVDLRFDNEQQSYKIYAKSILLESLLSTSASWPQAWRSVLPYKPRGVLTDTQVTVRNNQIEAILTRFNQLSWQAKGKLPAVANLSGALHWQPEQGRLELDTENMQLFKPGLPKQKIHLLNGALEWKELSNGFRLSIDRLVLSEPQLTLSLEGMLDEVTSESLGQMRLQADFSAKNLQQWFRYIPSHTLKPGLEAWLKNNVHKIGEATGQMVLNGMAQDFPFDNQKGVFTITAHTSGGVLLLHSGWPVVQDLETYIRVKGRNLDLDLVRGDFLGVPVTQVNALIDDIGKGKETLLLHGIVQAPAQKVLNFVMHTPLYKKLRLFQKATMKGPVALNLGLDIPLYSEEAKLQAQGELRFKDNSVVFHMGSSTIQVDTLTGNWAFTEKGISQGSILGEAFGYPLQVTAQWVAAAKPYAEVILLGQCTADYLKQRINSQLLSSLHGLFDIKGVYKIPADATTPDTLLLESSLEQLAIQLPEPLGKAAGTKEPLTVQMDFNPDSSLHVTSHYKSILSADLLFLTDKGSYTLQSGQIRLGNSYAIDQQKPGLAIIGKLDGFPLTEWKEVILNAVHKGQASSDFMKKLRIIRVSFDKFTFLKQEWDNLSLEAKLLENKDWSFQVKQKNIAGDLTYSQGSNTLSGYISHLHLQQWETSATPSHLHPNQFPNLNLRIDNVTLGSKEIGNMTWKSTANANKLAISYCSLESPVYQMTLQGDWTETAGKSQTQLELKLHLNNLAKSLQRLQIEPAVDAGKGDVELRAQWNNTLFDFSLGHLNGSMGLTLRKGIITHLSPETEEKLGLGKLLSILSLQTIPRRLTLDFSDLSHQGYSFDIFKGSFTIRQGIMSTQDSYIDGPVAYASMKGSLDLVRRLYDLDLQISPHITASLPIVATIAGGPIAGVAAWVANKIINQSMQKIAAYSYKISGPWSQPVVQQMGMVKSNKR